MEMATGAMGILLPKLGELLLKEHNLQKSVKQGIKDLMDELVSMQTALVKVSDVPVDQLNPILKIWADDVRDLSYVIEDRLDSFMMRVEGLGLTKPKPLLEFIRMSCRKVTELKTRHEIANDIKDFKIKVRDVKDRYDRYNDIGITSATNATEVDPRLFALYRNVRDLVGIDVAIDEVIKMLADSCDGSKKEPMTISIVGFGGLGKTTLAKTVYDKLNKQFDCGGFVPVGRNPDRKKVLKDILFELDMQMYNHASTLDERQLINQLRKFLANKRYLIVIDDIWDEPTWATIKCALVHSNPESIIITTTRIVEVAAKVGGIYKMKPLSDDNSKKLFCSRIYGEGISPGNQPTEVINKILRKCDGVPLSIITIASLLVGKGMEDWSKVYDAIGFGHGDNATVQNTRKILSFSYYDLPSYLKTCLLHLSVFPEDYLIQKNSLIWRWVAEGFILDKQGMELFDLGESYFNKLVDRSMIRWIDPSDSPEITTQGGCRVHDMVLDLIRTMSSEVHFVTIRDTREQHTICSPSRRTNKVRRLAVHGTSVDHNTSDIEMGYVRSFNAILCHDSKMPLLLSFKVLRVLILENCDFSVGGCHLENLGKLVHLRYLGVVGTPVAELPRKIGNDLKLLQILDVRGSAIEELPASVGELTKLMCLRADKGTRMMGGIGKLTSMKELQLHHVDKSPNFAKELGRLTAMRVLVIHFDEMDKSMLKALMESLPNLRRIQNLDIWSESEETFHIGGWEEWAPPSQLRLLSLSGGIWLPRLPSWIDSSCVPNLSYLRLSVEFVEARDLQILGRLPSLSVLFIWSGDSCSYTIGSDEFLRLRHLDTNIKITCRQGALQMLQELHCCASVGKDVGLKPGNMPLLQNVTYWLDCEGRSAGQVEAAETMLRKAAETHPNRPILKLPRLLSYESDDEHGR